jgi:hypothetical protein
VVLGRRLTELLTSIREQARQADTGRDTETVMLLFRLTAVDLGRCGGKDRERLRAQCPKRRGVRGSPPGFAI